MDRVIVTRHIRRFDVQGERSWITAARAQIAADQGRERAAAAVRREMTAQTAATARYERAMRSSGVRTLQEVNHLRSLERQVEATTRARERAAAREQVLQNRVASMRARAFAVEQQQMRAQQAANARQQMAAAAAAPVARRGVAPAAAGTRGVGVSLGPGLLGLGAAGYAGASIVRQGNQFDTAVRDAGAFANLDESKLKALGKIARQAGLDSYAGATEAARAAGELAKADMSLAQIGGGVLKGTLDLAKAGDVANNEAAVSMARALGVFDLAANKASHVADVLVGASNTTAADVKDFIMAFQAGASNAAAIGQSFDEAVLSMVLQAKRGVQNSDAGTSLKTSIIQLARNPTKRQAEVLKERDLNFFTKDGGLKELADISQMLNDRYRGVSPKDRTAELSSLVGTDGVRTLLAWASFKAEDVRKIKAEITQQGRADRGGATRRTGLEGAQRQFAARREEAAIEVSRGLNPALERATRTFSAALVDPKMKRELREIGAEFGRRGEELADGFKAASEDGRLKETFDGVIAAASAAGDAASAIGGVAGQISRAWSEVPAPIRESVVQSLVLAGVMRKIIGMGAGMAGVTALAARGGAAGAAPIVAAAGAGAGATRAGAVSGMGPAVGALGVRQNVPVPPLPRVYSGPFAGYREAAATARSAEAARVAAAQQVTRDRVAQTVAMRQANAAQLAAFRNTPGPGQINPLLMQQRAAAAQARAEAARAQAVAAQTRLLGAVGPDGRRYGGAVNAAREAQLQRNAALRSAAIPKVNPGRAAGVAAIGVGAAALSGGNTGTAAITGAMVGSMMGPAGAVGGAIAGAAGSELIKFMKGRGQKAAEEFGRSITSGVATGLKADRQKAITDIAREAEKSRPKVKTIVGAGGVATSVVSGDQEKFDRQQALIGRKAAFGLQKRFEAKRFIDPIDVKRLTEQQFKDAEPAAREAGTRAMIAWLRAMEGKKGVAKDAAARIAAQIGEGWEGLDPKVKESIARIDIRNSLGAKAGEAKSTIKKQLDLAFKTFSIPKPDTVTYKNAVSEGMKTLEELGKKTKTGSKEARLEASRQYELLERAIADYMGRATDAVEDHGVRGQAAIGNLGPEIKKINGLVGDQREAWLNVSDGIEAAARKMKKIADLNSLGLAPSKNGSLAGIPLDLNMREGGTVRRFREGGMVPIAVSPGEVIEYGGKMVEVPGARVAADSVFTYAPVGANVLTAHGRALLEAGMSVADAVAVQRPHFGAGAPEGFRTGGTAGIGPARTGQAARGAGFSSTDLVKAIAIAGAESGYRPGATNTNTNGSIDRGLWQINSIHSKYDAKRLFEPGYNARAAWEISGHGKNWTPWVTYNTGAYLSHMGQAREAAIRSRSAGGTGSFDSKDVSVPIVLGKSKTGRGELVGGSFAAGMALGQSGYSRRDMERFGNPYLREVSSALGSGTYSRTVSARGGGSDATTGGGGGSLNVEGATPIPGVQRGIGKFAGALAKKFGLTATSTVRKGSITANGNLSLHSAGRAVDLAGPRMREAAYWLAANKKRYGSLVEGIHNPGLSIKNGSKVPQGFWGSTTWNGHKDHIHVAKRRGGPVQRFAAGGTVGKVGGISVDRGLRTGGADFYERLALGADSAVYTRVESTIAKLKRIASEGGDSAVVARARASMSVLENQLGVRVGRMIGAAQRALDARSDMQAALADWQKFQGVDPSSAKGLIGQRQVERDFIAGAPAREHDLKLAVRRAERADLRTKEDRENLDAAQKALQDFRVQLRGSVANVAEFDRAIVDAARAEAEATRQASLDRMDRLAALTPGLEDDIAAKQAAAAEAYANIDRYRGNAEKMAEFDTQWRERTAEVQQIAQSLRDAAIALRDAENDRGSRRAALTASLADDAQWQQMRIDELLRQSVEADSSGDSQKARDLEIQAAEMVSTLTQTRRNLAMEPFDRAAAEASLTETKVDDIEALRAKLAKRQEMLATERLAELNGDPNARVVEAIDAVASLTAELKSAIEEQTAETRASTEQQLAITKQQLSESQATNRVLQGQNARQLAALSPRPTPAYPNRTPWGFG